MEKKKQRGHSAFLGAGWSSEWMSLEQRGPVEAWRVGKLELTVRGLGARSCNPTILGVGLKLRADVTG